MNEQSVTGIELLNGSMCAERRTGSGIRKKRYLNSIRIFTFFLVVICSVFNFSVVAADMVTQKAAIAAGVAAGTPISAIINDAVAAGMTPGQAVEAIVMAGADPGKVTYDAITAGYSAEAVVKGAASAVSQQRCADTAICSGQTSRIISAAQQAGASSSEINGWLASAGIPPTIIASANTQSSQGDYVPSGGTPLTSIVAGGGGLIGGSSIGSPTKQASPTKP